MSTLAHRIARVGNPVLRKVAALVSPAEIASKEMRSLIEDMFAMMRKEGGIGLAAPQIGISKQVFVVHLPKDESLSDLHEVPPMALFNPRLEFPATKTIRIPESCISVPGMVGIVKRYAHVTLHYMDENARQCTLQATDFIAALMQHESNHLFGKLYLDHLEAMSDLYHDEEFKSLYSETLLKEFPEIIKGKIKVAVNN